MQLQTYAQMYNKAVLELDLENELFVQTDEVLGYMNEAIKNAETTIHSLSDELAAAYFQVPATITLIAGQADYAFPSDIYATKVRKMFYSNGSRIYEIHKVKQIADTLFAMPSDIYEWLPINFVQENGGWKMRLFPTPQESGPFIALWYIRSVRQLTNSTIDVNNVFEIPECQNYVAQHIRWNVSKKTRRPDLIASEKADLETQFGLMNSTLKEMIPDENNKLMCDWSAYLDQEVELFY